MAVNVITATSAVYNSDGSIWGYTYTRFTYDANLIVVNGRKAYRFIITKVEVKATKPIGYSAGQYYILAHDYNQASYYSNLSHGAGTSGTSWSTSWTGSHPVDHYLGTSASTMYFSGAALPLEATSSEPITYNLNGGSGSIPSQSKYYGFDLRLSSGVPTRTGYRFNSWLSSNTSQKSIYGIGDLYTPNGGSTMTARWEPNSYIVRYDNNGGTGTIPDQYKTYDQPANFSTGSAFTKKETINGIINQSIINHWNTSADDSGNRYELGGSIPNISNTLSVYAIYELTYLYPKITNVKAYRTRTSSLSDKDRFDKGEYIYISFDFISCSDDGGVTYKDQNTGLLASIKIDDDIYTPTLTFSDTQSGTCEFKANVVYSLDNPHNVIIELKDSTFTDSKNIQTDYITSAIYPIDLYSNDQDEVFMGIMHPYKNDKTLIVPDTTVDGDLYSVLQVDGNASKYNPAISGKDKDLFNLIRDNGLYDALIHDNEFILNRLLEKIFNFTTVGKMEIFAGSNAPSGWLLCNGQEVSRSTYEALYSVIGTTYGSGDGSTTFNVPDMRNRMAVGAGDLYALNDSGGSKDAIIPYHSHSVSAFNTYGMSANESHSHQITYAQYGRAYGSDTATALQYTGAIKYTEATSVAHVHEVPAHLTNYSGVSTTNANMPPYRAVNFIIYSGV